MDTTLLRTFVTVARCGSFSGAAAQLGYTQSAVSQQMATLEADLGAVLLHRRPVTVTEAGARLLEHAGPLLLRLDAARAEVARVAGSPSTLVRAGTAPLAGPLLAVAAAHMYRAHPRAGLTITVAGRDAIAAGVASGDFDLGLVDGIAVPGDPLHLPDVPMQSTGTGETDLAVIVPSGHPLAGRPAVTLASLADARWIDAPGTGIPLAGLRAATGTEGFSVSLTYWGTDVRMLAALAAAGHGLTLLPAGTLAGLPGITGLPLTGPPLVYRTELVHGTLTSPAAATLATALTAR